MGSYNQSLTQMYDELRIQEKILQNELRKDDMVMITMMESMIGQSSTMFEKTEDLNAKLNESEKRNFNLEQEIRTLKIQLEEEKEAKVDLEITNIKLSKDLRKLQTSLESVNNNCYDDVGDLNLSDVSEIGGDTSDLSLLHDLSDSPKLPWCPCHTSEGSFHPTVNYELTSKRTTNLAALR